MTLSANSDTFAPRILTWFAAHGRHDLPWQQHQTDTPNPYIVWLSEVMLQQTQVTTVIPYFTRFMSSFPTVQDLARADWDDVAEHWAGLGYYARARNLHKGAGQLVAVIEETGDFPQTVDGWQAISGVGQSTAGAIVAMGLHGYGVICDGNVKRVLTRWAGIDGDITKSATNKQLWALATALTPKTDSGHYAQAMMDMGATLCTRRNPDCERCPVQTDCVAYAEGRPEFYPVKAKKKPKPSKFSDALILRNPEGETLWLQRPDSGIWGGLWCLPLAFRQKTQGKKVLATHQDDNVYEQEYTLAEQVIDGWLTQNDIDCIATSNGLLDDDPIKHTLTHFHWYLQAKTATLTDAQMAELSKALDDAGAVYQWLSEAAASATLGVPKAMGIIIKHFC